MCHINQFLQLIRGAVPTVIMQLILLSSLKVKDTQTDLPRGSIETGDLVTKTAIVGVFHDSHKLYGIVTQPLDPGKHIIGEVLVGGYLALPG